ncbi:MAG: glycosyltransferase family 9 protein, partial [Mesorhizobium sp.]
MDRLPDGAQDLQRARPRPAAMDLEHGFPAGAGRIFFDEHELAWAAGVGAGFVLMEPNVEAFKSWASNKRWPADRYDAVAARLAADGAEIVQFAHGDHRIRHARQVRAPSFRHAMAALARASLYVGPEGGMHHGAAAVGVPGVVPFGGFIPPDVTGYAGHVNLTGGAKACGSLRPCAHCRAAMQAIRVEDVTAAAQTHL